MLPSKGKFALYGCPYLPSGNCGRPYCPFNHSADTSTASRAFDAVLSNLEDFQNAEFEPAEFGTKTAVPYAAVETEPEEDDLIPQLEALFGMEDAPKLPIEPVETPKYEPTPISELKKLPKSSIIDTLSEYTPTQEPVKKIIKVEEYVPQPASVEEYVPASITKQTNVASYVPTKKSESPKSKSKSKESKSSSKSSSSKKSGSASSKSSSSSSSKSKSESHKNSSSRSSNKSSSSKSSSSKSHHEKNSDKRKSSSSDKREDEKRKKQSEKNEVILSSDDDDIYYEPTTVMLDDDESESKQDTYKPELNLKRTNETRKQTYASVLQSENRKSTDSDSAPAAEEADCSVPDKKRRIAHATKLGFPPPRPSKKIIRPVVSSIAQVLNERWKKQQEMISNPPEEEVPDESKDLGTRTGCQPKGKQRVAHQTKPQDTKSIPRPKIIPSPSKVPAVKRQYVLDQLVDVCLTVYTQQTEAFEKAVELETAILAKATTSNVYTSLFISQKKLLEKCTMPPPMGTGMLSCTPSPPLRTIATIGADSRIERIGIATKVIEVKGELFHKLLSAHLLSKAELKEHGFPLPHESEHGRATVFVKDDRRKKMAKVSQRECARCGIVYSVDETGMPEKLALDDLCVYHPKRTYRKRRDRTTVEDYYMCCDRPLSTEGCESNRYHVSENPHNDHLAGFVTTKRSSRPRHKTGVFALDCEMCITTDGTACTRVTVIDENRRNIYDALVKPEKPVLDYITRFSGITEDMMVNGNTKSLRQVQKELLQIFRAESILIGHSLQGDLMVLKMIHKNVVDTSIVFPHREGLPKRRALKNLAKDYLMRLIQMEESGHDSSEDALACMDLMFYKAREIARSL